MKGIFALDIDGTLTDHLEEIDPKVAEALKEWAKDWQVALLTGRIFSFAWKILKSLDFPYVVAIQNGADIISMPGKTKLAQNYLTPEILPAVEAAYQGEKEDFIIYSGIDEGDFCYYRPGKFSPQLLPYLQKLESLSAAPWKESDFQFSPKMRFSLIKCFGKEEAMQRVHEKLKKISGIEVSMIRDPVDPSLFLNLITHPHANKGEVVTFLRNHFQIPLVIAAGDDRNDLKMLKEADIRIVIDKAPAEVLSEADIFAKPANELGIIAALEEAVALAKR